MQLNMICCLNFSGHSQKIHPGLCAEHLRNGMPAADHRVTYQIPLQRDYASIAEQYGTIVRKNISASATWN